MNKLLVKAVLLIVIGMLSVALYPIVMGLAMVLLSISPALVSGLMLAGLVWAVYALLKRNSSGS